MIARLSGTLVDKQPGLVIVDAGGVGYELTIPLSTFRTLGEPGSRVDLHVHMHVREDTMALFGFGSLREKALFTRLLDVNGIGPKTAIAVLSGLGSDELIAAVRRRDAARLASVPGIGRKTAERIVLEVADKLELLAAAGGEVAIGAPSSSLRQDLISALVNLGYNSRVASDASDRVLAGGPGETQGFELLLRHALKILAR